MIVAHQNHMWFKFKLQHFGGTYSPLEPPIFTQHKYIRMDKNGSLLDNNIHTRRIPLNFKVEFIFQGELCCVPNEIMLGSDVEQCFQIPYFRIQNLVLTATLIDSMVVHMGKTHVFVIMTMNNGNHYGPLTVSPLCKGHVCCRSMLMYL